jgi:hypothetical protein
MDYVEQVKMRICELEQKIYKDEMEFNQNVKSGIVPHVVENMRFRLTRDDRRTLETNKEVLNVLTKGLQHGYH